MHINIRVRIWFLKYQVVFVHVNLISWFQKPGLATLPAVLHISHLDVEKSKTPGIRLYCKMWEIRQQNTQITPSFIYKYRLHSVYTGK